MVGKSYKTEVLQRWPQGIKKGAFRSRRMEPRGLRAGAGGLLSEHSGHELWRMEHSAKSFFKRRRARLDIDEDVGAVFLHYYHRSRKHYGDVVGKLYYLTDVSQRNAVERRRRIDRIDGQIFLVEFKTVVLEDVAEEHSEVQLIGRCRAFVEFLVSILDCCLVDHFLWRLNFFEMGWSFSCLLINNR